MRRTVPSALCAALVGVGLVTIAPSSPAAADPPSSCQLGACTVTYASTGATQTFTVPSGVSRVTVSADGATGGSVVGEGGFLYAAGGGGGRTTGTIAVEPAAVLTLVVGAAGGSAVAYAATPVGAGSAGGYGGGGAGGDDDRPLMGGMAGGGGGSFVFAADDSLLLAAGGGGGAAIGAVGGNGGGADAPATAGTDGDEGAAGGQPGTTSAHGGGGAAGDGGVAGAGPGQAGSGGVLSPASLPVGGKGGPGYDKAGGGGGGGYRAGGGGGGLSIVGPESGGAGGGAAGYAVPAATGVTGSTGTVGTASSDGAVTISWALPAPAVTLSAPATSTYGDPVALTATVTGGATAPTGTVAFRSGATVLCTAGLNATGATSTATCTTTALAAGTASLTAAYAGSDTHGSATSAATSVTVAKGSQSLAFTSSPPRPALPRKTYQATAIGQESDTAARFSAAPASASVCTVSTAGAVRFTTSGVCVIRATQPATTTYEASPVVTQSVTVSRLSQRVTFKKPATTTVGKKAKLVATSPSGSKITFRSLTTKTCTVSGTQVTAKAPGSCTVVASAKATPTYGAATARQTFKVKRG